MNAPKVNEVWRTNSGRLALIVAGPPQYIEIDGAIPPGATYFPNVYPARREPVHQCGMMMLTHNERDGWQVSEIQKRLKEKTDLMPWEYFATVSEGVQIEAVGYYNYLLKKIAPAETATAE